MKLITPLLALLLLPTLDSLNVHASPPTLFAFDNIAVKGDGTLDQKLDDLKHLGYAGLSWTGTDVAQIKTVIVAAEKRGLKLAALYVPFPLTKEQLRLPPELDEILAALAGHDTILWAYVQSKDFKPSDPAGDGVAVPALRDLADRAAGHDVKVALYPHAGFWAEKVSDCLRLADQVDRPNLGLSFNLCHALKTGDEPNVPALIRRSKSRLFMVTINGADAGVGPKGDWDRLIQPIGQGSYDLPTFLRLLRSEQFTGPVGFQGYNLKGDRPDILRASIEAWRKIAAPWGAIHGTVRSSRAPKE